MSTRNVYKGLSPLVQSRPTHDMASDTDHIPGMTVSRLIEERDLSQITCLRDEILVIGVRQSYKNLAVPTNDGGPMDFPTKGLALLTGPDCTKPEIGITPGMVVFFPKFSAAEVDVDNRRYFIIKGGDAKAKQLVREESIEGLIKSVY